MSAIIIKADAKSNKILKELAERLGGIVINMNNKQYEDFLLGTIIEYEKTEEDVPQEEIFKKLHKK